MSERLRDFELEKYFSRWEFAARHHLTASDAETLTLDELLELGGDGARERFAELSLGYIPTWGTDELRSAIARRYEHVDAHAVLTFAGAGEALYWIAQRWLEPGDHAVCTVPNYQSIESVPLATGAEVSGVPLWRDTGNGALWCFDVDRALAALRPNTRLFAVNFPNNPTGLVPPQDDWVQFLEKCHERGVTVLSDEVYRGLELDSAATLPQAADVTASAISVNVLSKAYGLPGLRVGWVACRDGSSLARLERAKHYTSICNAAPSEFLATIALEQSEQILRRNRELVRDNDERVRAFVGEFSDLFEYETPDGGCVCFARYLGRDGVETFCRRAVEEAGVLLLPASIYRSELLEIPADRFRIGIGRRNVPAALDALGTHLRQLA